MKKITSLLIIFLLTVGLVFSSGCIKTTEANNTFGEKKISMDSLEVVNNTTAGNFSYEGTEYYYLYGYIKNNNPIDAIDVKMKAIFYSANGSVVATNKTVYIDPNIIPANSETDFYFEVKDPERIIVKYKIDIISAKSEY